jgi:hypothetical protein
MELKHINIRISKTLLSVSLFALILIAGFISCKNDGSDASGNCICNSPEKPDSAFLTIKVTKNNENPYVVLTIYNDKYDPNRKDSADYIVTIDTTNNENTTDNGVYSHKVPVDEYYSVKAKYKSGQKIIYVFDGSIFQAQQQSDCQNTCWQMVGGNLDATLVFR